MKTKTFTYKNDTMDVEVTVSQASYIKGALRSVLSEEQKAFVSKLKEQNTAIATAEAAIRIVTYPVIIASTLEAKGFPHWPLTYEELAELPEDLAVLWESASFEVNPHWEPRIETEESSKKD